MIRKIVRELVASQLNKNLDVIRTGGEEFILKNVGKTLDRDLSNDDRQLIDEAVREIITELDTK